MFCLLGELFACFVDLFLKYINESTSILSKYPFRIVLMCWPKSIMVSQYPYNENIIPIKYAVKRGILVMLMAKHKTDCLYKVKQDKQIKQTPRKGYKVKQTPRGVYKVKQTPRVAAK